VGGPPVKRDSLIHIVAPFHRLNPCPQRNSHLFHEFLTILSGFVTNFFENIGKG
jgi:hypothetical protein